MTKVELIKPNPERPSTWEIKKLPNYSKEGVYIDNQLISSLDRVKQVIKNDWDFIYIFEGRPGVGKSSFAIQLAWYLSDGKVNVDDICFNPKDFTQKCLTQEKYRPVIFDEGGRGLYSRNAMSEMNKELCRLIAEIRQQNLFLFICLPSVWDLDRNIVFHRSNGVFSMQVDKNMYRGYWRYYTRDKIKNYMANGGARYTLPPNADLNGRFTKWLPVDQEAYVQKKKDALMSLLKKEEEEEKSQKYERYEAEWRGRFFALKDWMDRRKLIDWKIVCPNLGFSAEQLSKWRAQHYGMVSRRQKKLEGEGVKKIDGEVLVGDDGVQPYQ